MSYLTSVKPNITKPQFIDYAHSHLMYKLKKARLAGKAVYMNTVNKLNNCEYAKELNGKFTIRNIFRDNWEGFVEKQNKKGKTIRQSILDNVDKMIHCKDFTYGYLHFDCPNCNTIHWQDLSYHSRFCASYGKKYRDQRANEIAATTLAVPHRHITWTIAKELRIFFKYHLELYNELFQAVNDVLTYMIKGKSKKAKRKGKTLGFISSLHTFGRDLKHNPHIHTLIAEVTIDRYGEKKPFTHFNYDLMRKSFMKCLLDRMQAYLSVNASQDLYNKFMKIKYDLYHSKSNGFYVHAPKTNIKNYKDIKRLVNYVCRCAGHPAISESRILEYNKETKMITYCYDPHEDDAITNEEEKLGTQYVTETVDEFIAKLIIHIPNEAVHTTRYYGFYANHTSVTTSNFNKLYKADEINKMKKNTQWRIKLKASYDYDPLLCECGHYIVLNMEDSYFIRR